MRRHLASLMPVTTRFVFFLLHEQPPLVRRKTIAEALRVVKPSGKLVIVDYHRPAYFHPLRYLLRPLLRMLEPYALDLWENDIVTWLPAVARLGGQKTDVLRRALSEAADNGVDRSEALQGPPLRTMKLLVEDRAKPRSLAMIGKRTLCVAGGGMLQGSSSASRLMGWLPMRAITSGR
jgi:hypothetical protein